MPPKEEKQKISAWVPQGLVRKLEIEMRGSKDPTIQTMSDAYNFCLEVGLAALSEKNQSESGRYAAHVFGMKRQKEFEEELKKAEYEIHGWTPRDFGQGKVTPIRRVEEG